MLWGTCQSIRTRPVVDDPRATIFAMQIAIAQLNQRVGDLSGNAASILAAVAEAERGGARLVVTPELSLCGYPPEDLVLRPAFIKACESELTALAAQITRSVVVVGFPELADGKRYNVRRAARRPGSADLSQAAAPNTVFDEQRYFSPDRSVCDRDRRSAPGPHHLRRLLVSRARAAEQPRALR